MTYPSPGLSNWDDELKAYIDAQDAAIQGQVTTTIAAISGLKLPRFTSAARPSASVAGIGSSILDTTLGVPLTSDGAEWFTWNGSAVGGAAPAGTPSAPQNFTVVASTNGTTAKATLTWSAPSSTGGAAISGYTVGYAQAPGPYSAGAVSGVVLTNLVYGVAYTFSVYASNANGAGAVATTTVTMPADPSTGTGALPAKLVGGWWAGWQIGTQSLANVPNAYDLIYVAFAQGANTTSGTLVLDAGMFGSATNLNALPAQIAAKKALGKKVLIGVGGWADTVGNDNPVYRMNSTARVTQAVTSLQSIITTYGFDGFDIDLENNRVSTDASFWLSWVSQMKAWRPGLIVTVCGMVGSPTDDLAYFAFCRDLGANLDICGPQFYAGGSNTAHMATLDVMTKAPYNIPANKIWLVYGVTTEPGEPSTEWSQYGNTAGAISIFNTVKATYPTIRGAYVWTTVNDLGAFTGHEANAFSATLGNTVHA
jgi:hypothetical protein